ncbi:MAG TPA: HAMP domain-containing protein, partial [Chromatiales bacterium]|nr:HAMP domain-containing protein [Chromatiales bacterium]
MVRSRLLWRLYAGYAVLVVLTTAMLGIMVARSVEGDLLRQIESSLRSDAVLLGEIARPYLSAAPDSVFQRRIWVLGAQTGTRLTVIRPDGVVIADSREDPSGMDNHKMRPEVLEALARGVGTASRYSHTLDQEMMYVAVPLRSGADVAGFIRAALPLARVDERVANVRSIVLLGGLSAALLALLIGFLVARSFTRPIARMTAAAGAIADGDYNQRLPVDRGDEIGRLAAALNSMTTQLREHIQTITADKAKT